MMNRIWIILSVIIKSQHEYHYYNIFALIGYYLLSTNNQKHAIILALYYIIYLFNNLNEGFAMLGSSCLTIYYIFNKE